MSVHALGRHARVLRIVQAAPCQFKQC
jgi:hypothetical protein